MALPKRKTSLSPRGGMRHGSTDIFRAAAANDVEGIRVALNDCDVNASDENGLTALHYAASTLAIDAINFLLTIEGIDATRLDKFNRTAAEVPFDVWRAMGAKATALLLPHCHPPQP